MSHYNLDTMAFDAQAAAAAMSSPQLLAKAFNFDATPQGRGFWEAQSNHPTPEGLAILQFMLQSHGELTAIHEHHLSKEAA